MRTDQDRTVIFLHIPKAGGTTLHRIMQRQYPADAIYTVAGGRVRESIEEFKRLPESERRRLRALKGHMPFGLHQFLPQPSTYFTMLRDPVERVISNYYYVLRQTEHHLHERVIAEEIGLHDYVRSGMNPVMDNGQTRLLAGVGQTVAVEGCDNWASVPFGACTEEMLVRAKSNLEQYFSVVGLMERFDETLVLVSRVFRWRLPFYARRNVTRDRPGQDSISDEVLQTIRQYNTLDAELYAFGQHLFAEALREHGASFQRHLRLFRILNMPFSYSAGDRGARFLLRQGRRFSGEG